MKPPLLFVSNLFPDSADPVRGLDNATLLHRLGSRFDIRILALRPGLGTGAWRGGLRLAPRPADAGLRIHYLGIPYVPKFGSRWNHRLAALRLHGPVARWRAENPRGAVLGAWMFPDGAALAAIGSRLGFRPVLVAQGSDIHQYLAVPARRRAILSAADRAAMTVTRSGDLAERLVAAGADPARVTCVYNGVDTDQFRVRSRSESRAALDLPPDRPWILCVGNLLPVKNPGLLVDAVAAMSDPRPSVAFAGTGPMEAEIHARCASRAVDVRMLGRLRPDQIALWMSAADLLCIPSLNEGVPNVLLEAQAAALPVIATAVGGIPEIVRPGLTGTLVPGGDAPALATALAEGLRQPWDRARIRVIGETFSWETAGARYVELLVDSVKQA
jgi:teichuronic acid biosynthesis glycosyltransferase TuaC